MLALPGEGMGEGGRRFSHWHNVAYCAPNLRIELAGRPRILVALAPQLQNGAWALGKSATKASSDRAAAQPERVTIPRGVLSSATRLVWFSLCTRLTPGASSAIA